MPESRLSIEVRFESRHACCLCFYVLQEVLDYSYIAMFVFCDGLFGIIDCLYNKIREKNVIVYMQPTGYY